MTAAELGVQAFWLVIAAGVISGFASWVFFRRWSDPAMLRAAVNGIVAHLFELRLFSNEPVLVLRAQRDLVAANARLLRQMIVPSLILALPLAVLLIAMDAVLGKVPLQVGKPAIVTVQCSRFSSKDAFQMQLAAPAGIEIETSGVHVTASHQISWRVRPLRDSRGDLRLCYDGSVVTKSISSEPGLQWLSDTRAGSVWRFLRHPAELPFSSSEIEFVSVGYPTATVFHVDWLVWFTVASFIGAAASALLSRSRKARSRWRGTYLSY